MADLITLARAKENIPSATSGDDPTITALITAVSVAIRRYCRRDFNQTDYDELYNGNGQRRLFLRQYPILSVSSVRYRPVTVLKIQNSLANTPQARVSVTTVGLTLVRVTNGVKVTDTSVTFAGNVTILAIQNAVNALGSGWSAVGQGYDTWPSADLRSPQGALTAAGQYAELKLHTYELAGYQIDERRGWLLRAIPYTDPELLHPEDLIWPTGVNNFRVQYTAGYTSIPDDVQEACAEWVSVLFWQTKRDPGLTRESVGGAFARGYTLATVPLPPHVAALLAPYRQQPITISGG
jgi:hypothetical protein